MSLGSTVSWGEAQTLTLGTGSVRGWTVACLARARTQVLCGRGSEGGRARLGLEALLRMKSKVHRREHVLKALCKQQLPPLICDELLIPSLLLTSEGSLWIRALRLKLSSALQRARSCPRTRGHPGQKHPASSLTARLPPPPPPQHVGAAGRGLAAVPSFQVPWESLARVRV